jgi:hypothetical protein
VTGVQTCALPISTQDWFADWRTGTGSTNAVLQDTDKFGTIGGLGLEVVSASGLGFPGDMANVLRVTPQESNGGYGFLRKTGLGAIGVGQSDFRRWYCRVESTADIYVSAPDDGETHPFQDGNANGDSNWLFHVWHSDPGGVGGWSPEFRGHTGGGILQRYRFGALAYGAVHRFERKVTRTSTTEFTMDARAYDTNDTTLLAASGAAWNSEFEAGTMADRTFTIRPGYEDVFCDGQNAALNGLGSGNWSVETLYMYQGGLAMRRSDWCGPYTLAGG